MNTAGAPARRRGRPCRRRARRGRRASPVITRLSLERQLALLPRPTPQVRVADLFDSVPPLLQSPSGVLRHVIEGHIVQESSTPFTTGLSLQASPESEQADRDRRPWQQPCATAGRDPRPASDSPMVTPSPPPVAQDASERTPSVTLVSPERTISPPARSETPRWPGADNVQPPQEHEQPVQQEQAVQQQTTPHEQRYVFIGRQARSHRDPNVASRSINRVTAGNDGIVVDVPCPNCPSNTIVNIVHCRPFASATTAMPVPSEPLQHAAPPAANAPLDWTVDDVAEWIRMIPLCAPHADRFRKEEIDGRALVLLDMEDLQVRLALPLGAVVKIFEAIRELHESRRQ